MSSPLTPDQVRAIAKLARLAPAEADIPALQHDLAAVLTYIDTLSTLNLQGIEPLAHVSEEVNRLDPDTSGPTLSRDTLMTMAPETSPPYIKVPKVM